MERITLKNITLDDTHFERLHVALDDNGHIIILPLLWSIHLAATQTVFRWKTTGISTHTAPRERTRWPTSIEREFVQQDVAENTLNNYFGHLFHFLEYLNELDLAGSSPSVHQTHLVDTPLVNQYLNSHLASRANTTKCLVSHQAAISAFYNFLFDLEIKEPPKSVIYRKTRQKVAELNTLPIKSNYISKAARSDLLYSCSSLRDRLIIRMGYEVGLRSEENTGLRMGKSKILNIEHAGLTELFDELESEPHKNVFLYKLHGKYTKGGRSRNLLFDRKLVEAMHRYAITERNEAVSVNNSQTDAFFVRFDPTHEGEPISSHHASKLFNKLKKQCKYLSSTHAYHDLRHTFATELYHQEVVDKDGRETRSESAALLTVQKRLGHADNSRTTARYIHLRKVMMMQESDDDKK